MKEMLKELLQYACRCGATQAVLIDAKDIMVMDELADRCRQPRCENYGLSKSCPPHVAGPHSLRKELEGYKQALFFKIDVPSEMLFSSDNQELFRLLHEIAAGLEQAAIKMGMYQAKAFAGDSCKRVFCAEHLHCQALAADGKCRYPQSARPSMSGFGINVLELLRCAGWETPAEGRSAKNQAEATTYICGLVLLY